MLKNITLSADAHLIELAREKARKSKKTLNTAFREWLLRYTNENRQAVNYFNLMQKLQYVKPGKHFTRDEMNER